MMIFADAIILIIADIINVSGAPSPAEQKVRMLNKQDFQIFK